MLHTLELLPNFDFYVCLRVKFHKSSFWVLILAAGGPYWVSISQKNGSLLGPYLKAWGSLIVLVSVDILSAKFHCPHEDSFAAVVGWTGRAEARVQQEHPRTFCIVAWGCKVERGLTDIVPLICFHSRLVQQKCQPSLYMFQITLSQAIFFNILLMIQWSCDCKDEDEVDEVSF